MIIIFSAKLFANMNRSTTAKNVEHKAVRLHTINFNIRNPRRLNIGGMLSGYIVVNLKCVSSGKLPVRHRQSLTSNYCTEHILHYATLPHYCWLRLRRLVTFLSQINCFRKTITLELPLSNFTTNSDMLCKIRRSTITLPYKS